MLIAAVASCSFLLPPQPRWSRFAWCLIILKTDILVVCSYIYIFHKTLRFRIWNSKRNSRSETKFLSSFLFREILFRENLAIRKKNIYVTQTDSKWQIYLQAACKGQKCNCPWQYCLSNNWAFWQCSVVETEAKRDRWWPIEIEGGKIEKEKKKERNKEGRVIVERKEAAGSQIAMKPGTDASRGFRMTTRPPMTVLFPCRAEYTFHPLWYNLSYSQRN